MDKIKTPATRITDAELNELLREVVKGEILKDARPTLESLKALHADRPLLVLALSQAIEALTERDALRREVEAGKGSCPDCGFVLVEDSELPTCHRCDSQEWQRMYHKQTKAYNELIMAVSHKYEGESRHKTALRYIQQAEQGSDIAAHNPEAFAALEGESR